MNGEGSVPVDRGHWLYRFDIDADAIAIYRCRRAGQDVVGPDVWRCLAALSVSDVFIVELDGGWQPFVELADGQEHWALAIQPSRDDAEHEARHFLETLAAAQAQVGQDRDPGVPWAWAPPEQPIQLPVVEGALSEARAQRELSGWELVYSRQREYH